MAYSDPLATVGVLLEDSDDRAESPQKVRVGITADWKSACRECEADAELFRKFSLRFDLLTLNERGRIHAMLLERLASFVDAGRSVDQATSDARAFSLAVRRRGAAGRAARRRRLL